MRDVLPVQRRRYDPRVMPVVQPGAECLGTMLCAAPDPEEEPWQPTTLRLLRNSRCNFLDLGDERIHFPDIEDERFQRLIEIILKVCRFGKMLCLPGEL